MNASGPGHATESQPAAKDHHQQPASTKTGALAFGIYAIIGAIGCPPLGIVFAYYCVRAPKKSAALSLFAKVVSGLVALSVIIYSFLFASGSLPLTGWMIPGK